MGQPLRQPGVSLGHLSEPLIVGFLHGVHLITHRLYLGTHLLNYVGKLLVLFVQLVDLARIEITLDVCLAILLAWSR